ncbi:MAG: hypothetical protein ACI4PO_08925, partial [Faecousia sp.]
DCQTEGIFLFKRQIPIYRSVTNRAWCSAQRIKISMTAGGNHTIIIAQWRNDNISGSSRIGVKRPALQIPICSRMGRNGGAFDFDTDEGGFWPFS